MRGPVNHTTETRALMAAGMRRHYARRGGGCGTVVCETCGDEVPRKDADIFRGRWSCGPCLVRDIEPLHLEDFTRRQPPEEIRYVAPYRPTAMAV